MFFCFSEPQFNKDQPLFTHINSTHARMNLQGWTSGGCPITAVLLEFRPKGTWAWQSVRTNASADIFLAELREATWYELKMKACNSAGCGNQSSQFATLDYDGSKFKERATLSEKIACFFAQLKQTRNELYWGMIEFEITSPQFILSCCLKINWGL